MDGWCKYILCLGGEILIHFLVVFDLQRCKLDAKTIYLQINIGLVAICILSILLVIKRKFHYF